MLEQAEALEEEEANEVSLSFSGSWYGYHSKIYYKNLEPTPAGARFSIEWGFSHDPYTGGTVGEWVEYPVETVINELYRRAEVEDETAFESVTSNFFDCLIEIKEDILSCLSTIPGTPDDFIKRVISEIEAVNKINVQNFINYYQPKGSTMSRDSVAILAGQQIPPHITVLSKALRCKAALKASDNLLAYIKRAVQHMKRVSTSSLHPSSQGTRIFIGHGRSPVWKELRDFLRDRLKLEWEEFNRVPMAGQSTLSRLAEMLDSSAFAFLLMTPEDEQLDGEIRARENVVHEAGLFQGRLGFSKAIILREEGCAAFGNIDGLGEIRFIRGNIIAAFEDIREVLEREQIISKSGNEIS